MDPPRRGAWYGPRADYSDVRWVFQQLSSIPIQKRRNRLRRSKLEARAAPKPAATSIPRALVGRQAAGA
eukprot:15283864-Alexandrium_andersonii.AAC.1